MRGVDLAFLAGRILFGGFFLYNAFNHLVLGTAELTAYAAQAGVPFPQLAILGTGLLMLAGGLSVVLGAWPRVGLALLVLFLVGVTPMMHAYWMVADPAARMLQQMFFLRNVAFLGAALALYGVPVPWRLGVTRRAVRPARRASRS